MPPRFERGAVIMRARRFGVVWHDDGRRLTILPIEAPETALRHDFLLDVAHLLACGVGLMHATIRPQLARQVGRDGQTAVGTAPSDVQCALSQAMVRMAIEAEIEARWAGDSTHRNRAKALCR